MCVSDRPSRVDGLRIFGEFFSINTYLEEKGKQIIEALVRVISYWKSKHLFL